LVLESRTHICKCNSYDQTTMKLFLVVTLYSNPLTEWPHPEVIPNWPHVSLHNGLDGISYLNLDLPATVIGMDFRKSVRWQKKYVLLISKFLNQ